MHILLTTGWLAHWQLRSMHTISTVQWTSRHNCSQTAAHMSSLGAVMHLCLFAVVLRGVLYVGSNRLSEPAQSTRACGEPRAAPRTAVTHPQVAGAARTRASTAGTAARAQSRATVCRRPRTTEGWTQTPSWPWRLCRRSTGQPRPYTAARRLSAAR